MANAITKVRQRKGLSVLELAVLMDCYPSTLYRLEARPIEKISMDRLRWAATALGTTAEKLLKEKP